MTVDPLLASLGASSSGMSTQSLRMRITSENLSNIDTPGYQRKLLHFRDLAEGGVEMKRLSLSDRPGQERYEPFHPMADENGMVISSNVDLMVELADAKEARRSFDANLQAFRQAQGFYRNLLQILEP